MMKLGINFSDLAKTAQLVKVSGPQMVSEGDEIGTGVCLIPKSIFSDSRYHILLL